MKIEKKVLPEYFQEIIDWNKKFELRLADWECKKWDILILKEWDSKNKIFTGRVIEKKVTYVKKTKDIDFWTKDDIEKYGYQVISFK